MTRRMSLLLFAALAVPMHPALAADAANGQRLARTLCTNCHIVEPDGASNLVSADVPSFMAIAKKPGQTAEKVEGFVLSPHPPMPQVQVTTAELADLAAYVMSLKD